MWQDLSVEVQTLTGHTLFNPEHIIAKNKGEVPLSYQKLQVPTYILPRLSLSLIEDF